LKKKIDLKKNQSGLTSPTCYSGHETKITALENIWYKLQTNKILKDESIKRKFIQKNEKKKKRAIERTRKKLSIKKNDEGWNWIIKVN